MKINPEVQSALNKVTAVCVKLHKRYPNNPTFLERAFPRVFKKYCVEGQTLGFVLRAYNLTTYCPTVGQYEVCHDGVLQVRGTQSEVWDWLRYNGLA